MGVMGIYHQSSLDSFPLQGESALGTLRRQTHRLTVTRQLSCEAVFFFGVLDVVKFSVNIREFFVSSSHEWANLQRSLVRLYRLVQPPQRRIQCPQVFCCLEEVRL